MNTKYDLPVMRGSPTDKVFNNKAPNLEHSWCHPCAITFRFQKTGSDKRSFPLVEIP